MNYRHEFHAGNFADVFKHAVLARILVYLARKPAPFRFIDTHAGSGRYSLAGAEAARTGEWRSGIGRIDTGTLSPPACALLQPFLAVAGAAAGGEGPYPGSPAIAQALLRPLDRMLLCETHPGALHALRAVCGGDKRAKAIALDGYTGLNAFIPPVERRGLVLVDPPFESEDEFARLAAAIGAAHAKWREGILMAWFPIKDRRGVERMIASAAEAGAADALLLELHVDRIEPGERLRANGLLVVNPPYVLADEMRCLLPELARQLGTSEASWRVMPLPTGGGRS